MKWETLITAVCCVAFATGCTSDPYKSMKTPKAAKRTSPLSGTGTPTPKRRKPVIDFSDLKPAKRDTSGDPPILDQTIPTSMPKVDPLKKLLNKKSKQSLLLGKKKSLSFGADTGLGNGGGFGLGQKKSGGLLGGSPGLSLGGLSLDSSLNPNLPSSGLGDDKDTDTDTDTDTNDPPSSQPTSQPSSRPVATTKPVAPVQNDPDTDLVPNPPKNEYPKDGIIAKINERPIKAIDFERSLVLREKLFMLQKSRAPSAEEVLKLKKSTLKALISQILLYQRAKQRGVTVSDKEKSLARQQFMSSLPPGQKVEDFLKVSKMTRAQFEQRFLEQVVLQKYMKLLATEIQVHPSKLKRLYKETMGDGEVKARHIVVTLSEDASEKDKAAAELRAKKTPRDGQTIRRRLRQYRQKILTRPQQRRRWRPRLHQTW